MAALDERKDSVTFWIVSSGAFNSDAIPFISIICSDGGRLELGFDRVLGGAGGGCFGAALLLLLLPRGALFGFAYLGVSLGLAGDLLECRRLPVPEPAEEGRLAG